MNSVTQLMSSSDIASHDIAAAAQTWQLALCSVGTHFEKFDLTAVFMMPTSFSFTSPGQVATQQSFTNILTEWRTVSSDAVEKWQAWLNEFASQGDMTSIEWVSEILTLMMDD